MRTAHALVALACLAGCGGSGVKSDDSSTATPPSDADTAPDTDTAVEMGTEPEPEFYALRGTLEVASGAVDAATASIQVELWAEDTEGLSSPCTVDMSVDSLTATGTTTLDVEMLGWWTLALSAPTVPTDCPAEVLPDALQVGFGPYDPLLDPATAASGLAGTWLYGLYVLPAPGDFFIVGVAGTSDQFDELVAPVTEPPLPDGIYELRTLHLIPL